MAAAGPILVASDLTARGDRPLDRALSLARNWQAPLALVHAIDSDSPHLAARDQASILSAIREELPEAAADADIVLVHGSADQAIVRTSAELDSRLIVTGVAHYDSLGDILLGTTVDHVVRHARAPVLIVKRRPLHSYHTLVVGTDFSACSLLALQAVAAFFPDALIHLVHVYHVPYESWLQSGGLNEEYRLEAQRELDAFLDRASTDERLRGRLHGFLVHGDLCSTIGEHIKSHHADLLVLGSNGHGGLVHATLGSKAETLMAWAPCDVLMVHGDR